MSKLSNDVTKQIMKDFIDQKNIIDIKVFFVESKINLILKKHFKKKTSNIESIEKALNIVLNEKNLNTIIKKLKKFKQNVVYEIVYCMKKQFKNSIDENNLLFENDYKLKKKKKTLKNNTKSLKKSHKKRFSKFYERIDVFKNVIKKRVINHENFFEKQTIDKNIKFIVVFK